MNKMDPDPVATPEPVVTIAIPVFNSAPTLARCLRSAMSQTIGNIEILVADDASTDGSAQLAESFAAEDSRIRVMRLTPNGGKPRAMNHLVAASRAQWIAVLDADDEYHPQRIEILLRAAEQAGVEMAADNLLYVDAGVGRALRTGFDPALGIRIIGKEDLLRTASSFASFDFGLLKPMVRRDFILLQKLEYYDTRLGEDFYYLLEFLVAGGHACVVPQALYHWTLPFGTVSRKWTGNGSGAWRYDYRSALQANAHFLRVMQQRGETSVVAMLHRRDRQYRAMIPYIDAQRYAAERRWLACAMTIIGHPRTWPLLGRRVGGRAMRRLRGNASAPVPQARQESMP